MKAHVVLALGAAACAHASTPPPELRGCWIERGKEGAARTMRWFPEGAGWRGDRLDYRPGETPLADAFHLKPEGAGWTICPAEAGAPHGAPCQPAFFGAGGAEDHFEVHASAQRLRLLFRSGDATLTLFDGARDGCD